MCYVYGCLILPTHVQVFCGFAIYIINLDWLSVWLFSSFYYGITELSYQIAIFQLFLSRRSIVHNRQQLWNPEIWVWVFLKVVHVTLAFLKHFVIPRGGICDGTRQVSFMLGIEIVWITLKLEKAYQFWRSFVRCYNMKWCYYILFDSCSMLNLIFCMVQGCFIAQKVKKMSIKWQNGRKILRPSNKTFLKIMVEVPNLAQL